MRGRQSEWQQVNDDTSELQVFGLGATWRKQQNRQQATQYVTHPQDGQYAVNVVGLVDVDGSARKEERLV